MKTKYLLIAIAILTFLSYSNTFTAPFHWDDHAYIVKNLRVKDLGELLRNINGSRFIGFLTFYVNFSIAGLSTPLYHLTNLLIHILNALLIFVLVKLIMRLNFGDAYREYEDWIAFFGALLFGLHPVNTMAVTYISQRFGLLCTLFYLSSVYFYLIARLKERNIFYILSLFSTALAMKSKEMAFTIPFVILFFEFLYFRQKRPWHTLMLFILSLFIIPLSTIDALWYTPQESLIEKTAVAPDIPRHIYLLTQLRVLISYLRLFLFPVGLNIDYDYPLSKSLFETDTFFAFIFHFTVLVLAITLLRRPGHGRFVATGIFWYYMTLSVESSIFPISEIIMEYRLYLPFMGLLVVSTGLVLWFVPLRRHKGLIALITSVIILIAGILTFQRNSLWSSERAIWEDAVKKSPNKIRTRQNYADTLPPEEAIREYEEILKMDPYNRFVLNALANALIRTGRIKEAEEVLKISGGIAIEDVNIMLKAEVCINKGDHDCALANLHELIKREPGNSNAYFLLGLVHEKRGKLDEAERAYRESLRLDPKNVDSLNNLANILGVKGQLYESLELLKKAQKLRPDIASIYINLGATYAELGDYDSALRNFDRALKINPRSPDAWFNKGLLMLQAGLKEEGLLAIKKVLEIDPGYLRAKRIVEEYEKH